MKNRAIVALLLIALCFCGCQKATEDNENSNSETISSTEDESTLSSADLETDKTKTLDAQQLKEAKYIAGSDKGYAWVWDDDANTYLLSMGDATVLAELPWDCEIFAHPTSAGYTLVEKAGEYAVLDKNGQVVFSENSLGNVSFILPSKGEGASWADFVIPSMEDGYLMAYQVEETHDSIAYKIGVVDMEGTWVSPLSEEHPIIKGRIAASGTTLSGLILYAGEGYYTFANEDGRISIYDVENGSVSIRKKFDDFSISMKDIVFQNGRMLWKDVYVYETYYFCLLPDGSVKKFATGEGSNTIMENGDTYVISEKEYFWIDGVLWDRKNLESLPESSNQLYYDSEFPSGYRPVIIENEAYTKFFGLENASGYKFEPVKLEEDMYNSRVIGDGNYCLMNDSYYWYVVYDYEGNQINSFEGKQYSSCNLVNGVLRYSDSYNGVQYLDVTEKPSE